MVSDDSVGWNTKRYQLAQKCSKPLAFKWLWVIYVVPAKEDKVRFEFADSVDDSKRAMKK